MNYRPLLLLAAALLADGVSPAQADVSLVSGAASSASARLNFRITIPTFLRFRIGSDATDTLTSVFSNGGQVTITESNNSSGTALAGESGIERFISYAQVRTVSSDPAYLPPPSLSDTGGNTALPVMNTAGVTNRTSVWTYSYANTEGFIPPSEGSYRGAASGQVIYTAAIP